MACKYKFVASVCNEAEMCSICQGVWFLIRVSHQNFQMQTKDLSLNLCSSIRFVLFHFILFLLALCNPLVNYIL